MKTEDATLYSLPHGENPLFGIVTKVFALLSILTPCLMAQTSNTWPKPTVAIYDCNCSAATTGDPATQSIINTSSRWILQDILHDTSSQQVSLFSYGYADTTATDFTLSGFVITLPDSGRVVDADYIIASTLVRSVSNYTLTVSLLDGRTFSHAIDAIATFVTVSNANVQSACLSAVQKILPLTTKIRNYQELLKSGNPALCINPQIVLVPAQSHLALKGNTTVAITATDCDGTPIINHQLTLSATDGSFGVSTVQTDVAGNATALFTAGGTSGVALVTATLVNALTVTHDTISPNGSEAIVVGTYDSTLWVMTYTFSQTGTAFIDSLYQKPEGTAWIQYTTFFAQSAQGKFFGPGKIQKLTDIEWHATSGVFSGSSFAHSFEKDSSPLDLSVCPSKYWAMSGSSWSYIAKPDSNQKVYSSAEASYDPKNNYEDFAIDIPYTMVGGSSYMWYATGNRINGECQTSSHFDGGHAKAKLSKTGLMSLFGTPGTVLGLSIVPVYSNGSFVMCTITVNGTWRVTGPDGIIPVMSTNEFVATLKPFSALTTSVKEGIGLPKAFSLAQNYPNPFNPSTIIQYDLPAAGHVTLLVYNMLGQVVAKLVDEAQNAGTYKVKWDGSGVASGMYFYRLQAGEFISTKKAILIK